LYNECLPLADRVVVTATDDPVAEPSFCHPAGQDLHAKMHPDLPHRTNSKEMGS